MPASQTIIPRSRVIPGARDDDYHVDDMIHSDDRVKSRSVTITSATVQALNMTPVTLLPAKTGRRYIIVGAHVSKAANAYGAGANVTLNYIDTGNTLAATFAAASFTEAAAVANAWATLPARTGTVAAQTFPTGGIDVNVGTAFTGTGGDVTITALYVERDDEHELDDANVPLSHTVTLDDTAVQALHTTPFLVLAAKAGKKFLVLGAYVNKAAGAYAGGAPVVLRYTSAGNPTAVTIPTTRFTAAGQGAIWIGRIYAGSPAAVVDPGGGLELSTGTAFTGAGGDVSVTVRYVEIDA